MANAPAVLRPTAPRRPHALAGQRAAQQAVLAADTLLLTLPNQLGVAYNATLLATVAKYIAPALGWTAAASA